MSVESLARWPAPLRRALYFGLQRALGSRITAHWRDFLTWECFTAAQHDAAVDLRLSAALEAAISESEFYRGLRVARRDGELAREWLRRFPVLTRTQVRSHFSRLVIDRLRPEVTSPASVSPRRYDWLVVKTGGTTGTPTSVVHDACGRDSGRATRLYGLRLCGFPLGTPYFRLWGSEQDLLKQSLNLQQRLLRALHAEVPLNAFKAKDSELRQHLATMAEHPGIEHLMTYVDAAVSLAAFIEDKQLTAPRLKTIMACAGTLTGEARQLLAQTFSAEVFDKYGSRDCSDLACECNQHRGLHVFSPHAFIEIVDDAGQPCAPGQMGRVLVTLLNNRVFPLIRYEIGDLATWAEPGQCPCGSPFPRLASIEGRQDDLLTTEDGTLQSSAFVRHFVGVSLNRQLIREWQFEQTDRTHFIFRYVPFTHEGLGDNLARLHEGFQLVFGRTTTIEMREVDEIPSSPAGKTRWIVNSYRMRTALT